MDIQTVPHFHNEMGVSRITVGVTKFMCMGALPPNDHPHVFLDMGAASEIICPYCGTVFSFDRNLGERCDPPQCAYVAEPQADFESIITARQDINETPAEDSVRGMLLAAFKVEEELQKARDRLQSGGFGAMRTYAPVARDDAASASLLPVLTLAAGAIGFLGGFCMQAYANMVSYPLNIGGHPNFSWPSFVPIAFEIGMLTAVLTGIFGYFVAAPLLSYFDPVDETMARFGANDDIWVIALDTRCANEMRAAKRVLNELGASSVEEIAP